MHGSLKTLCKVAIGASAVLMAACASTRMDAQWTNPAYQGKVARGGTVLVACEAQDLTLQRICEDQLAAALSARGAKPTLNSQLAPATTPPAGNDPYVSAAKRVGARAIARMTLGATVPVAVDSGPRIGIGVGGGSWGGGGSSVGGGVGVGFPIGGARVTQAFGAETALIDPSSGATMWSGRASSSTNQDVTGQITELAQVIADALAGAGML